MQKTRSIRILHKIVESVACAMNPLLYEYLLPLLVFRILAAFTVPSGKQDRIDNLSVAENTNITKEFIDNVHLCLQDILRNLGTTSGINSILGRLKWKVYEYD